MKNNIVISVIRIIIFPPVMVMWFVWPHFDQWCGYVFSRPLTPGKFMNCLVAIPVGIILFPFLLFALVVGPLYDDI